MGTGLFYGPTAVGVIHRDLFNPMPLQVMAFILVTVSSYSHPLRVDQQTDPFVQIQVCLLEFATGRYEARELNTAAQYNMYISHIRGLELYQQRAPRRLARMQQEWFDYAM
jgi:hypothetical protein